MGVFVRRSFGDGHGVRFGVVERVSTAAPAGETRLSTGPAGEFRRQGAKGLYFADQQAELEKSSPEAEALREAERLWRPDPMTIGALVLGGILILLGVLVMIRKGPQGLVEIVLGAGIIAAPFIMRARERREFREKLARERAERAEIDRRNREVAASFTAVLHRYAAEPGAETLAALRRERESNEVPYDAVAGPARDVIRAVGFRILSGIPPLAPAEAAAQIDEAIQAAGLKDGDAIDVKLQLWRRLLWHLLADDRLTPEHQELMEGLRRALAIPEEKAREDEEAATQFSALAGLRHASLPKGECGALELKYKEVCHLSLPARRMKLRKEKGAVTWVPAGETTLHVTSRRLVIAEGKKQEIPLTLVDQIELDADSGILSITTPESARPLVFRLEQPLHAALVLDLAAEQARQTTPFS